jgi:hypothetical protein
MKTSEILMNALDIIDTPGQWTKGAFARKGSVFGPSTLDVNAATCFCSLGAIRKVSGAALDNGYMRNDALIAEDYLMGATGGAFTAEINDAASSPFDRKMSEMWLTAIFCALADESE